MGAIQEIFKRVEKKYIVTDEQQEELVRAMTGRAAADNYGLTTICNIYYDTPDHQLIRTSMEKPVYKEKLRIRSYGVPTKDSKVFVELKKKYKGVVYKRRVDMSLIDSYEFENFGVCPGKNPQIEKEIEYFLNYYHDIGPAMYLSYDRIAFALLFKLPIANADFVEPFKSKPAHIHSVLSAYKPVRCFVRRYSVGQNDYSVKINAVKHRFQTVEMPFVNGIERPSVQCCLHLFLSFITGSLGLRL